MHLLLLQIILTIWTGLAFVNLILALTAMIMLLTNNNMASVKKLVWTFVVILLPLLGPVIFFAGKLISSKDIA